MRAVSRGERVIVTRRGTPFVVVVAIDEQVEDADGAERFMTALRARALAVPAGC